MNWRHLVAMAIGALIGVLILVAVHAQEPAPLPRVVEPDRTGLDLTRWGWSVDCHVIQIRQGGKIVHECATNGLPQLAAEVRSLALQFVPRGPVEMRIYSTIADHWCRADGSRLDTASGWFACEVKVHAGSLTL